MAWPFDLLARHQEIEAKVLAEIDAVTKGEPVRAEHVSKLVYTRQGFSEAMRLYPPAPIITRTALQEFQLGDYLIPAGTVLIVPIYAVHHHTSLWSKPGLFNPDRFEREAAKARHRYAYMPFGAAHASASAMLLRSWKPSLFLQSPPKDPYSRHRASSPEAYDEGDIAAEARATHEPHVALKGSLDA